MFKKNKIITLVVLFLFMFIGIDSVSAATGMYCIYAKNNEDKNFNYVMLSQDVNGNKKVYVMDDNLELFDDKSVTYDSLIWDEFDIDFNFSDGILDVNNNFNKCPMYLIMNYLRLVMKKSFMIFQMEEQLKLIGAKFGRV